jgi:hypothetical protein
MGVLKEHGGLFNADIAAKLISFWADGMNVFQGVHNGVIRQMKNK